MSIFRKYTGPSFLCAGMSFYRSQNFKRYHSYGSGSDRVALAAASKRIRYAYRQGRRRSSRKNQGMKGGLSFPKLRYNSWLSFNGPGLFPQNYKTHVRYNYFYTFTDAGGFHDWVHRGNSIFDPDFALGGESGMGIDALSAAFTSYHVLASAIRVRAVNNDTDDPVDITIYPSQTSASYNQASGNSCRSQPLAKFIVVSNQQGQGQLNHYARTKDMFAFKSVSDVGFQAGFGSDPTHQWYWHIYMNNHQAADHPLQVQVWVEIDFTVVCSNHYAMTQT